MKDESIRTILNRLNKGTHRDIIFTRPLSSKVDYGHVWFQFPSPNDPAIGHDEIPHRFYFIKNQSGTYVGAVLDMVNDLHWYVLPAFRSQGHIFTAMTETIFNDLAQDRQHQTITIRESSLKDRNFKSSTALAVKLGFVKDPMDSITYILDLEAFQGYCFSKPFFSGIDDSRANTLKKRIVYAAKLIALVQAEVEFRIGDFEYAKELSQLRSDIRHHSLKFEDAWMDAKEREK